MIYYRCKCGEQTAYGSMPPNPCDGCEKCGTNLATAPGFHEPPKPHDFVTSQVKTDEGQKPLTRCRWCGKLRDDIKAAVEGLGNAIGEAKFGG